MRVDQKNGGGEVRRGVSQIKNDVWKSKSGRNKWECRGPALKVNFLTSVGEGISGYRKASELAAGRSSRSGLGNNLAQDHSHVLPKGGSGPGVLFPTTLRAYCRGILPRRGNTVNRSG